MRWRELVGESSFPEIDPILGERFGAAIAASDRRIVLQCDPSNETAARDYLAVIGRDDRIELRRGIDCASLERWRSDDIPLVFLAAIEPTLKDRFFRHPNLHLFADHHYAPMASQQSCALFTVGTTARAMEELRCPLDPRGELRSRRCDSLRARYGERFFGYDRFGAVLRSPGVKSVRVHALGPKGTNISRAAELFVADEGIEAKSEVIVHGRKVEPLEYAAAAASEACEGALSLHMECAVYYALGELFERRRGETVFAGHRYMPLDAMQLACRPGFDRERPVPTIAAHPSPIGLIAGLIERELVRHIKASSNADAAEMVKGGEADLCITTEAGCRSSGLITLHRFGSPTMIFTVGAAAGNRTLARYLSE